MSIPKKKSDLYSASMDDLYRSHAHLYDTDTNKRRTLLWGKLWDTTNKDYGRFQLLKVQKKNVWDSPRSTFTKSPQKDEEFSGGSKASTPAHDQLYSRHMTPSHVDILKTECSTANADVPNQCLGSDIKSLQNYSQVVLPQHTPGEKVLAHPTRFHNALDCTRGVSAVDRSRPHLTSGYAKNYVSSTQNIFWDNMETARVK